MVIMTIIIYSVSKKHFRILFRVDCRGNRAKLTRSITYVGTPDVEPKSTALFAP